MFASESDLSIAFRKILPKTEWSNARVFEEVEGLSGIPDYVLIKKYKKEQIAIGIELKLHNWQRAMRQAFKYKAFCNISYVIMDSDRISPAIKNMPEFILYNIGLASIDDATRKIKYYYKPIMQEPFSYHLQNRLKEKILV